MLHQHDSLSFNAYSDATKLAASGEEFSHLISLMNPDHALRLKLFVQELPQSIATKTIYGKAHWKEQSVSKQRSRK
jgi:NADH:ubiquinone oxidoreductase subunit C